MDTAWIAWTTVVLVTAAAAIALAVVAHRRDRCNARVARTDALTGLGNRAALAEHVAALLARGPAPALLLLDLDGFRDVNDTLGHTAGDALLRQVADVLHRTAGDQAEVTRLGGDEFAVLVPGPVDAGQADVLARRLLAGLAMGGFTSGGVPLDVQGSIGFALSGPDGATAEELLQHADVAMYAAKRARVGVLRYDPAHDPHSTGALEVLGQLRQAMEEDQLVLHYQPKVAGGGDGRLLGFEALVRWQHPTRGLLPPAAFLPFVERTRLIHPLTRWVLLTAARQAATWRARGLETTIAVNISAACLDEGLLGVVEEALALTRWPAQQLVLEITETAIVVDPEGARRTVQRLRERGVRVSVDDFGAGATSLVHLRGLAVHELKVDRQFVTELMAHPEDEVIVSSVIALAHRLGLVVVAEGVEDPGTAERLRAMGCDELQGYLFARPLPAAEALGWALGELDRRSGGPVAGPVGDPAGDPAADPA
ncbi:bifunctional diguanylate cyclase/phosphodiesterase [Paenibacillus sp. TRM 82003]|uniref:putative bifunctional diguanylate cyclase/phosphodiesterase n=1 Tax=Kineococcus sp. TRM81007 TaxID=2925831 RepID=UPI001F55F567|nr:bifunctional diguanylate cyclase/phosphodiesterase [Kineococcus sp. TRM81007]MCI2238457.1 bifunctional diguanylate cyclase/phosphodiesterase [Kineococcus sp. TRM81007]MCI3922029.1 bifunctional diguanylate cyclase/phosphodiesterase [Paenibacillus sp. TRM 82003]